VLRAATRRVPLRDLGGKVLLGRHFATKIAGAPGLGACGDRIEATTVKQD
jgi:hypothetical protein